MADALNIAINIITIAVLAAGFWWLIRWEQRRDRRRHRAAARARLEINSIELSETLIEVRRHLAGRRPQDDMFIAEYMTDLLGRPAPDERPPPLHSV